MICDGIREIPQETITGVALLSRDGRMWSLPAPNRHGNLFALAALQGVDPEPCEQGFVTSRGAFLNRVNALSLVKGNGQKMRNPDAHTQLYSEDVW